jgi:glycosyltransferase involved in cell wall biosynthesis
MTATNAAILFEPTAYDGNQKQLKGRHVAGASFLDGFVRYADVDEFVGVTFNRGGLGAFGDKIAAIQETFDVAPRRPARAMALNQIEQMAKVGTVYTPDPMLDRFVWNRRFVGQRAYSVCGITHTVSSKSVMQALADYLTAPVQPWDALICTSTAVRDVVQGVHQEYGEYLEARIGARPPQPIRLPVIPLGLDVETFVVRGRDPKARAELRQRFGIADGDVLALFLGRLAFHAKAHCTPMYVAMQRAQERLAGEGRQLHLLMTGQFANEYAANGYREAARLSCPDVPVHFLDGTPGPESWASWAAADVFLSLSDNIQESFGITPIEAMAAGLPCVVSDWDGYKDTVPHGEAGFRVRSRMAMPGVGVAISRAFSNGDMNYDRYIGATCLITDVDVDETAEALATLARDADLRRRMGEAGTARARALYDWSVIIPQYQELWAELGALRMAETEIAPPPRFAANPIIPDPIVAFRAYPSDSASEATRVSAVVDRARASALFDDPTTTFVPEMLMRREAALELFDRVSGQPGMTIGDAIGDYRIDHRTTVARTIMWFAKFGAFSLGDAPAMVPPHRED